MKIVSEEYHSNGQVEYRSTLNECGVGHNQSWYKNGNRMMEFYFKNGCFGIYKWWFENGGLETIEQNKRGIINGMRIVLKYK